MTETQEYYVRRRGRVDGPWSLAKLRSEVALRKLGRHHDVSTDGEQWRLAQEVEGLFQLLEQRKSVTSSPVQATDEIELEAVETEAPGNNSPAEWYYSVSGQQRGPIVVRELESLLLRGELALDDLVWREGFPNWMSIDECPELMKVFDLKPSENAATMVGQTRLFQPTTRTSRMAVTGLALAALCLLTSWIPLLGFAGLGPAVLSAIALYRIKKSNGALAGTPLAIGGIVLGGLAMIAALAITLILGVAMWANMSDV
jgi:hypothetical protein